MKALLIEFNVNTGVRSGNIDPNDPKLQCYGWQNLEISPQIEIRVIEDDRDVSQYQGIAGVSILKNKSKINKAIDDFIPIKYGISDQVLFIEHLRQRKINLDDLPGKRREVLKELLNQGIKGIVERKPLKV